MRARSAERRISFPVSLHWKRSRVSTAVRAWSSGDPNISFAEQFPDRKVNGPVITWRLGQTAETQSAVSIQTAIDQRHPANFRRTP